MSVGATLLQSLQVPKGISKLWDDVKNVPSIGTYERFILGLDFLFILGLIDFNEGKARRL